LTCKQRDGGDNFPELFLLPSFLAAAVVVGAKLADGERTSREFVVDSEGSGSPHKHNEKVGTQTPLSPDGLASLKPQTLSQASNIVRDTHAKQVSSQIP